MTLTTPIGNHVTGFALCLCCPRWAYSSGILNSGNAFVQIHSARCKGGCFHLPSSASGLGQKRRKNITNGPLGAGSQLDSLSLPGESCWMYSVRPPSASRFKSASIGELIRYRLRGFATSSLDGSSYIVSDQNALCFSQFPFSQVLGFVSRITN